MKSKIYPLLYIFSTLIIGFAIVTTARAAEPGQESDPARPLEKDQAPPTTEAIFPEKDGNDGSMAPMNITTISTDFENAEGTPPGFSPGYCAQNGWTAFIASSTQGQISNANPSYGSQNLRLARDVSVDSGINVGCFSPDIGAQAIGPSWMEVDIAISNTGGADYYVVAQAPSQGFLTARVNFYYLGDIRVLDDFGSGAQWVDTGWNWTAGPHATLRIEVDPAYGTIRYYYGGNLIYTGSVFAGTTIEQVVLFSDNWNLGDVADFDGLEAYTGSHPTSISLASFESQGSNSLLVWIIPAALVALLLPLIGIARQRFRGFRR